MHHLHRTIYVTLRQLPRFTNDVVDPLTTPLPVVPLGAPVPVPTYICSGIGEPPGLLPSPPCYILEIIRKENFSKGKQEDVQIVGTYIDQKYSKCPRLEGKQDSYCKEGTQLDKLT